ncbi:AraC family transcriptional regulator [Virgisporangium aliadipatigenens]|uniref:AraC family transcriptional regulator n=1 Tax=Virgisporangium aliadipatigenens TaxID=741659 RepID=A0A8J3YN74_9ACTN|nr:AraC family transcriptional regulator [Virgisporangium aliadipatigenens]GIJ46778.1 AraC family transcriptional regulator [Virgisporangium aliadipatigenens]
MDELAALLDGPRARNAFLVRAVMSPPWSIRIQDEAALALVTVVRGDAWIAPDDGSPLRAGPGDVVLARGPAPYTVADDPATPPHVVIHPGDRCTTPDGRSLSAEMMLGTRTWGNDPDGGTVMLVGTYHMRGEVSRRLLEALPELLVLPAAALDSPLVPLLAGEVAHEAPGQQAVLDRLLDLMLITVLRRYFELTPGPKWYRAQGDPIVGRVLRVIHAEPERPWTVAALAARAGVSRATLARRFTDLVGEPPMTYLTGWRLALAADLLREPGATVGSVARRVGYGTAFALSAAFSREFGMSPQQHREALASA